MADPRGRARGGGRLSGALAVRGGPAAARRAENGCQATRWCLRGRGRTGRGRRRRVQELPQAPHVAPQAVGGEGQVRDAGRDDQATSKPSRLARACWRACQNHTEATTRSPTALGGGSSPQATRRNRSESRATPARRRSAPAGHRYCARMSAGGPLRLGERAGGGRADGGRGGGEARTGGRLERQEARTENGPEGSWRSAEGVRGETKDSSSGVISGLPHSSASTPYTSDSGRQ